MQRLPFTPVPGKIGDIVNLILRMTPNKKYFSVLDLGFGKGLYGYVLRCLFDKHVRLVGVDLKIPRDYVKIVKLVYDKVEIISAQKYLGRRRDREKFDCVLSHHLFEHILEEDAMYCIDRLKEIADLIVIGLPVGSKSPRRRRFMPEAFPPLKKAIGDLEEKGLKIEQFDDGVIKVVDESGYSEPPSPKLSRYGHRSGTMAALLDDLLYKGVTVEGVVKAVGSDKHYFGHLWTPTDEKMAERGLSRHVNIKNNKVYTWQKSERVKELTADRRRGLLL